MCGIVGFTGNRQAAPILLDGLSKLEYRGYDSAGLAVRDGENLAQVVKAKGRLSNLIEKTDVGKALKGTCGIGHTRWATHGEPSQTNAHPHVSGNCTRSGSGTALAEGMFATADECSDYAASAANCAYELTFLLAGIVCFVYVVLIRKQKLIARQEAPKYAGAAFETAGQFAYIFALSDTAHVAISAPIISAYCVASVVWSRIFLKEKLSLKHYLMIALVVAGIVILGVYDA